MAPSYVNVGLVARLNTFVRYIYHKPEFYSATNNLGVSERVLEGGPHPA